MLNPEHDAELKRLTESQAVPKLEEIVDLAKKMGISDPSAFWVLFDKIHRLWSEQKSSDRSLDW